MAARTTRPAVRLTHPEKRVGKVFIDWSQNSAARSTATLYTVRGRAEPLVAAPRDWDELEPGVTQLRPDDVLRRLGRDGDLMARRGLGTARRGARR